MFLDLIISLLLFGLVNHGPAVIDAVPPIG